MANLTDRRFEKAEPLFKRILDSLRRGGHVGPDAEFDLRDCWNLGGGGIADCMEQLIKHKVYAAVGAAMLEDSSTNGSPRSGSKHDLADAYGATHYTHDERMPELRRKWFAAHGINWSDGDA